ncbi:putative thiamine pyrophosphate enzyme [Actinoplanes missouriensis 431]|uniref:Putative thiamine pyrophosphate enzyme n=1 Tax=Actinoplanes missouriensis (strain ATCC 14538 / DSM 43046 / CBS 188.64 / JCM 3121 / NBRC 102363 / NCIMB 12654 / NRRL B-3342 / UNCC 431) TaxID=512565 RepID=I0H469_ACTM4|nr:thiamine pyrophosphate-binding protein [Actinoplanes missouriensis]BAL87806.1 putative thiamine pyrophosphate enzyme [Actinoplanes missouriensis 431]
MKLHAALARALAAHQVGTMFGLIGDANLFMVHSFVHEYGGKYVGAAHEAGAIFMGFGYADLTGRPGVVTVTHGPALTNTLTGLVEGVRGRTPMLLIAGDTATGSRGNIQDIAQRDVVLPTGAGFEQARTPESTLEDLAVALRRAVIERRPVVFNVPSDFMTADVDYREISLRLPQEQLAFPDPAVVAEAAARIAAAKRPVVLAGRGAMNAREAVLRLAERIGAPVATTLKARDLFRGEPFALGISGSLGGPATQEIIDGADLVVSLGAGLNSYTTRRGALLAGGRVIAVDTRVDSVPAEAGTIVVGDAGVVADALVDALDLSGTPARAFRTQRMAASLAAQEVMGERACTASGTVDVEVALRHLDEVLPERRLVVSDGGRFMMESLRHLHVEPGNFVLPANFGSIGLGMGTAIGAATADPTRTTVMVCGDGGFMHGGVGEFTTAVREGLHIIVVVCNDGGYGAEHIQFTRRGLDPSLSLFAWPDLAAVARAAGGEGFTVRDPDDLAQVDKAIADRQGPLLIDLRLDVEHMTPMP